MHRSRMTLSAKREDRLSRAAFSPDRSDRLKYTLLYHLFPTRDKRSILGAALNPVKRNPDSLTDHTLGPTVFGLPATAPIHTPLGDTPAFRRGSLAFNLHAPIHTKPVLYNLFS